MSRKRIKIIVKREGLSKKNETAKALSLPQYAQKIIPNKKKHKNKNFCRKNK